jgi:hypothetical protein
MDQTMTGWNLSHKVLGAFIIVWTLYFILLETMKIYKTGFSWQMIPEWMFVILSLALVIINFAGADDT